MSGLDALLIPGSEPSETPPDIDPDATPAPEQTPPEKPAETKTTTQAKPPTETKTETKPGTPPAKTGKAKTFREVHEQTTADLTKANAKIKELEAKIAKPVEDPKLKELQAKYDDAIKRLETSETELKYTAFEKTSDFAKDYLKPMEDAYANGVESTKGFRVTDEAGERHGTEKDFDEFMAIADQENAWKFAEARFGSKAPVMWQHRQAFIKALGAKNKAIEDYRMNGIEREKQTVAQRQETLRQTNERWSSMVKEGAEKYPDFFKEVDGDDTGNKLLSQGMALADLAFSALPPESVDKLPPKIQALLVNGKLPAPEMLKLHSAVRNMFGGFNRLVFKFRATETENKKLKEKIAGFEGSEPTGGGDGGGSPTGGKKEDSWESKLDKLAR